MKPIHSFVVTANLPHRLEKLKELAYNYWWCWNSDAKELFIRISRTLWEEVNHNPVLLINKVPQEKLLRLAHEPDFTSFMDYIHDKFMQYMNSGTWFKNQMPNNKGVIAYFSPEYGINESFPNYSGGLGVLAGDHLKSASDLGLPLVGIGLLYQQGYFRQHFTQNGWQNELYLYNDFFSMPLTLVRDTSNNPIIISCDMHFGKAFAQIWKLNVGRNFLFLLDTNIEQNTVEEYRNISDQLYGGDRETRIQQEIMLGIGGMRALEAMGIEPDVVHINEGHAAFALIERIKLFMKKFNLDFKSAKTLSKASSVFTTHTPVPAGNEAFRMDRIDAYLKGYYQEFGMSKEEFLEFGQINGYKPDEAFSMTVLALKMTSFHNGVSQLHGEVSRQMWSKLWKCYPVDEVPIRGLTNGIHTQTWVAREFAELFDRYLSPGWRTETDNPDIWKKIDRIPPEELWREKQRRRVRLVLFTRDYLKGKQKASIPPDQHGKINEYLSPDSLTIGFARRFATYKRANLIFKNMDRLKSILENSEKPVQMIIAGKAHPHDTAGKEVIQSIIQKIRAYGLEKHIVFLEDYDMVIARMMVKGCDVWLNNPIRPLEASGTSGMKAALNGTLNLSILDGWWAEGFDGTNGFAIGIGEEHENNEEIETVESEMIYDMLESVIVPMFYNRPVNRVPEEWVGLMKNCISSNAGKFSTHRMVREYAELFYFPALNKYEELAADNAEKAKQLQAWKQNVRNEWQNVEIMNVDYEKTDEVFVGKPLDIAATVSLGNLKPEDVTVQVYFGAVNHLGEIKDAASSKLEFKKSDGHYYFYEGVFECPDTGMQGFTIRVLPTHPLIVEPAELYLCIWA